MALFNDRITLLLILAVSLVLGFDLWLLQPRFALHDETLTIIKFCFGELDINRWPNGHTVIWWQGSDRGINVRLVVLPW